MIESAGSGHDRFDAYRKEAGLSQSELWMRYFELGGMRTGFELEAILLQIDTPTDYDRDVIALVLNERFAELGGDGPPFPVVFGRPGDGN
jgi:hypothetical protein